MSRIGAGAYCISGLAFAPQSAIATLASPGSPATSTGTGLGKGPSDCPEGTQVRVFTQTSVGAGTDKSFFLLLN